MVPTNSQKSNGSIFIKNNKKCKGRNKGKRVQVKDFWSSKSLIRWFSLALQYCLYATLERNSNRMANKVA